MVDLRELRRLAEASLKAEETWHHEADLHGSLAWTYGEAGEHYVEQDAAYIAAASPDVVLGLLDRIAELEYALLRRLDRKVLSNAVFAERDEARETVQRLAGALMALECRIEDGRETETLISKALADPVARRIVEGG